MLTCRPKAELEIEKKGKPLRNYFYQIHQEYKNLTHFPDLFITLFRRNLRNANKNSLISVSFKVIEFVKYIAESNLPVN